MLKCPCDDDRLAWSDSARVPAREVQVDVVEGVDGLSLQREAEISLAAMAKKKKKKLNGLERAISDPDQNVLGADAAALNQKCTRTIGTTPELLSHCSGC